MEKTNLEDLEVDGRILLKLTLKKWAEGRKLDRFE